MNVNRPWVIVVPEEYECCQSHEEADDRHCAADIAHDFQCKLFSTWNFLHAVEAVADTRMRSGK